MREVGKADLTGLDRRHALVQSPQLLAGTQTGGNGAAGHVTRGLDTGEWTDEALLVVFIGLGELRRQERELDFVLVDAKPAADELLEHLSAGLGPNCPLPTFHASQYTNICLSMSS